MPPPPPPPPPPHPLESSLVSTQSDNEEDGDQSQTQKFLDSCKATIARLNEELRDEVQHLYKSMYRSLPYSRSYIFTIGRRTYPKNQIGHGWFRRNATEASRKPKRIGKEGKTRSEVERGEQETEGRKRSASEKSN